MARVSPLQASILYLEHLRDAWNAKHPEAPIDDQELVITVPASFDPAARELTAEAAARAGYERLVLLEEPQAALYSWIQKCGRDWRERVSVGDVILVVDVGGGTTDFSLIVVEEDAGSLVLRRVAVGDPAGGYFFLPPWPCWAAWAREELARQGDRLPSLEIWIDGRRHARTGPLPGSEDPSPTLRHEQESGNRQRRP